MGMRKTKCIENNRHRVLGIHCCVTIHFASFRVCLCATINFIRFSLCLYSECETHRTSETENAVRMASRTYCRTYETNVSFEALMIRWWNASWNSISDAVEFYQSILTWCRDYHDQQGGFPGVRPFHCTLDLADLCD